MFKVQEFYCEDTPVDEDIREAIIYANTHNCAVKITTWSAVPYIHSAFTSEYIFPNEDFDTIKKRFIF
nr:hypothetical protein DGKKSRWO_DGKKSRWO_CDS_0150 [uncultured phage]